MTLLRRNIKSFVAIGFLIFSSGICFADLVPCRVHQLSITKTTIEVGSMELTIRCNYVELFGGLVEKTRGYSCLTRLEDLRKFAADHSGTDLARQGEATVWINPKYSCSSDGFFARNSFGYKGFPSGEAIAAPEDLQTTLKDFDRRLRMLESRP